MKIAKQKKNCRALLLAAALLAAACSTQPKKTGDTVELRNQAEAQLELGNKQADRGDYTGALIILTEAQRLAVITDDPGLRIRCALSRGNVLFTLGNATEALAEWEAALAEARAENNKMLIAVSRIHLARYKLLSGGAPAETVRQEALREIDAVKPDDMYLALGWMVAGLAEKQMGLYSEAEASLGKSAALHEKNYALEQAAYDWFLIGSFRSAAGNFAGAADALNLAVVFDRRVENSYGLAADWRALGDVYKKAGRAEESKAAYLRAARIFRSLGNNSAAAEAESRIQN